MKKGFIIFFMGTLLIMAILCFGGCSSDGGAVVAKVGDDKIYADDLNEIIAASRPNFQSFEDEYTYRRSMVDSMVTQQILVQEAYKKNIHQLDQINRIVLANRDRFLLDVLYQRMIIDEVTVSEDKIKEYYDRLEEKIHASHILVTNADTARMIIDSLKNGGNFEQLAVEFSTDGSAKQNRGDIGYFVWGQLDSTFQENLWKLNQGEISEPFETKYGWHIARALDREPNELRASFGKMKDQIKASIEAQARFAAVQDFQSGMREKYPIKVDSITCNYVLNKREELYPPSLLATLPNNDFDVNQLDGHERELIIATWNGGQLSLGQYLGRIQSIQNELKPNLDNYEKLGEFIFQMQFNEILGLEATRIGLEDDEIFKRKMKRFKELAMSDIMKNDSLGAPAAPDEGEIRQYYEENQGEFLSPEQTHIFEIQFNDYATAESYSKKIKTLDRFKSMASTYTTRPGMKAKQGDMGWIGEAQYPRLFYAARNVSIGKVSEPVQIGSKYSIIYVNDRKPEQVKDFLQVKSQIFQNLTELKNRDHFTKWIEERIEEAGVSVNENNIRSTIDKSKYDEN